jgi:ribosomal protein S18 acetylase RimI-like enzyme
MNLQALRNHENGWRIELLGQVVRTAISPIDVRQVRDDDREWIRQLVRDAWGAPIVVTRGKIHRPDLLPGFIAELDGYREGLLTYSMNGSEIEVVTLNSQIEARGIGSALINRMKRDASEQRCNRLWLITTNDNLKAIRFYQKRGFVLVAVHRNAIEISRSLKPEIPVVGIDGIPIRDEIEMELPLSISGV